MVHKDKSWTPNESEMGEFIHDKDWSKTSLGPIEEWPQALLSTLNICLSSNSPASICWGNELLFFYNDAWKEIMGEKHPSSLGQPAEEAFEDAWSSIDPHIQQVFSTGETQKLQDKRLPFKSDEYNCDLSLIPIPGKKGSVGGINIFMDIHDQKETLSELKNAVAEAEEQKQLYEAIISGTPDLVYVFDLNYRFRFVNDALLEMWGRNWEESIGKGMREVGYEDWHAEMHEREIDEVIQTKESIQGEVSFPHDKLGKRYYDYIFIPVFDGDGEVKAVAGITRDITERKQAEQALRKNEDKYRTLVENFPNGAVGLFNENLEYTAIGGKLVDFLGIAPEDRIGDKISDIYPKELYEDIEPYFQAALDGEAKSFEAAYHDRRLFAHTLPIEDDDGEIASGMLVVQDITERWQAQQDLRESEAKFRMIAENLNEVIWMMSADAEEFIYISPAIEEVWGIGREKLYEEPLSFFELIHPDDQKRVREEFTALPEDEFDEEYRIIKSDGEVRWIHSRGTKVHDDRGKISRIIGIGEDITERKEDEISNAHLSAIVENSDDAIISKDLDGIITSWNDSAERIFGYTADEAVGQPITIIIPDNRLEEEIDIIEQVKQGNSINRFETVRERKDGSLLDISLTISPIEDSEGNIAGASKIARDITDRKQAEEKLRKNKNRLRAALEIETVGVLFWGEEDFTITEVNDAFLNMSGYSREEALGKSWRKLTPEEFYPISKRAVSNLKESGHTEPYEKQYIQKDGSRWWGLFAPRRIDENEVVEFVIDITERKKAEEQRERLLNKMKVEKERLSDIFKRAPSFMAILRGPDHVFERANNYYRELMGDRQFIGKPVAEAVPEVEEQGFVELLDEVYETGEPFRGKEMGIKLQRKPDQPAEKRYLDFVFQPLQDHEGSITGIFIQGVDLTERHHAKEKLESMNETLEERVESRTKKLRSYQKQLRSLASELNKAEEQERQRLASELHDKLGQILTVAKMRVDGLKNHELTEQVSNDVEELKEIMDDALDYNRDLMSELKPPPALDKEDVREVVYWTANKMEKHGIDIIIEDDDQPKPVKKEIRTIIHQSVRELLFNVVKHADVDSVQLSMKRIDNQVQITVKDKGKGFDPKEEESLPVEEGFGLFNINERIEWHGGTFEIDSEPGKGTKATICAPLKEIEKPEILEDEDVEETLPPSVKEVVQAELWQKVEVLLVDDHDMVRRGLRQMIEEQDDMEIAAEAADGQEAIDVARETSPDVIVMDVNMPVLDGIEATQKIKTEMPNIRIIGLSLHDREEVKQDMRSAGASDYLTKDEAFETLCATIRDEPTTAKK